MLPVVFTESKLIFAALFLLLALRRIISLPSEKNTEKKILDASIWITAASLFYFWSLLFFIGLFIAIFQKGLKNEKYLFIPFVGFISIFVLTTVYYLLLDNSFLWFLNLDTSVSFNFSNYKFVVLSVPISFLLFTAIVALIYRRATIFNRPIKEKLKFRILFQALLISILLIVIAPNKNGSEFMFLFAPLSIFAANFIENSKKIWISELFLLMAILLPFLIYVYEN